MLTHPSGDDAFAFRHDSAAANGEQLLCADCRYAGVDGGEGQVSCVMILLYRV